MKEYPLVISDKFLKAAIKYADIGILALSRGPRIKGLLVGTAAATLLYAGYFIGPVRGIVFDKLHAELMSQHTMGVDFVVLAAGYLVTWLAIKFMAKGALHKMLPGEVVDISDKGLPSSGAQGWHALGTTLLAWTACAFFAVVKPLWVMMALNLLPHH